MGWKQKILKRVAKLVDPEYRQILKRMVPIEEDANAIHKSHLLARDAGLKHFRALQRAENVRWLQKDMARGHRFSDADLAKYRNPAVEDYLNRAEIFKAEQVAAAERAAADAAYEAERALMLKRYGVAAPDEIKYITGYNQDAAKLAAKEAAIGDAALEVLLHAAVPVTMLPFAALGASWGAADARKHEEAAREREEAERIESLLKQYPNATFGKVEADGMVTVIDKEAGNVVGKIPAEYVPAKSFGGTINYATLF